MAYAVELVLDEAGDAGVRGLWAALEEAGIPSLQTATHRQHVPHVSLTVCDNLNVDAATHALAEAMEQRRTTDIILGFAGAFPGPPPVVFAGVVGTDDLFGLQAAARKAISPCADCVWDNYLPNRWVPHCTLAMPVRPDQVGLAIETVLAAGLPVVGRATGLAIAEVGSGDVVHVVDLR
jgi:hypothetical protein